MKLYQCDLCGAITNNKNAVHRISYTAPQPSNYQISRLDNHGLYAETVYSFDKYLCKNCAKQVIRPFISDEFFEGEEDNDNS